MGDAVGVLCGSGLATDLEKKLSKPSRMSSPSTSIVCRCLFVGSFCDFEMVLCHVHTINIIIIIITLATPLVAACFFGLLGRAFARC